MNLITKLLHNSIKNHSKSVFAVLFIFVFFGVSNLFANVAPGTLEPNCAPGAGGCVTSPLSINQSDVYGSTVGSILFSGTGTLLSQDPTQLFWDDASN